MSQNLSQCFFVSERLGFRATEQMKVYNPNDAGDSDRVALLMHFFELVHIGDMIQSMVQVYFDKELVRFSQCW